MTQLTETHLIIGKDGITENVVKQAKTLLRRKKMIKIKFLPSAITKDKTELFKELANACNAKLNHKVGFMCILERIK